MAAGYSGSASLSSTEQTTQSTGEGGTAYIGGSVYYAGPPTLNSSIFEAGSTSIWPWVAGAGALVLIVALIVRRK